MSVVLWGIYFSTVVIGYVGMKIASTATEGHSDLSFAPLLHPWGVIATVAWLISGLIWPWILAKHPLSWANAFSSVRILLVSVAAVMVFGESITQKQIAGVFLIMVGVCLSK